MKINGRILRATNLQERRVLKSLGLDFLRVPRRSNPYALARVLARAANGAAAELGIIREVLEEDRRRPRPLLPPFPPETPLDPGSPWCPDAQAC